MYFNMPFWQTAVGGTMEVAGQVVQGGQNIFFAQLADSANIAHFSADATRYFSGEFIFMIFGLPGAALAMYRCAKPEKKKAAGGLLLSAALACMFTGITEPLEFSFLFVAPALFVVQVILAGAAYMIAHMLNIAVGLTSQEVSLTCSSLAFCREMQNKLAEDHSGWYYLLYPVLCNLYIYDQEI